MHILPCSVGSPSFNVVIVYRNIYFGRVAIPSEDSLWVFSSVFHVLERC